MDSLGKSRRFDSLDALRGFACFLVIWQHVSESLLQISSGGKWTSDVANYFDFGRIGVVAFFCISGFVIPSSLRGPRLSAIRRFAINRFFRLYPPYWVSIGLAGIFFFLIPSQDLAWDRLLANLGMVAIFFDQPHIMGLFWTLEIELIFYVSSAVLYLIFGDRKIYCAIAGFLISYIVWQTNALLPYQGNLPMLGLFLTIMFSSSMARCVYDMNTAKLHISNRALRILCYATLAVMVYLIATELVEGIIKSFRIEDPSWHRRGWGHLLGMVLFAGFFFIGKSPHWLTYIGRCTYSAYLLHALVFEFIKTIWIDLEFPHARLELYILLSAAITFGVAIASYRWIELPFIKWGKHLARPNQKTNP